MRAVPWRDVGVKRCWTLQRCCSQKGRTRTCQCCRKAGRKVLRIAESYSSNGNGFSHGDSGGVWIVLWSRNNVTRLLELLKESGWYMGVITNMIKLIMRVPKEQDHDSELRQVLHLWLGCLVEQQACHQDVTRTKNVVWTFHAWIVNVTKLVLRNRNQATDRSEWNCVVHGADSVVRLFS